MSNFFYVRNLSSRDLLKMDTEPWEKDHPLPTFPSKEKFREWCVGEATDHRFITLVEPTHVGIRCNSHDNPPKWMRGYIADFDSPKLVGRPTNELISEILIACTARDAIQPPNWICRTYSGKVRLIWQFEDSVLVDNAVYLTSFMKKMIDELRVDRLLVGGRDVTSDKPDQFFEIGTGWEAIHPNPVASSITTRWFYESALLAKTSQMTRVEIPLAEVEIELHKRFPGRWQGDFSVGARGPLFWIDDGIDRVGCQVGDYGMICYSDRAGSSFLSWEEIFGKAFVIKYESKCLAAATGSIYYDGGRYYEFMMDQNKVEVISKDDLCLRFRVAGFSDEKVKRTTSSEIDNLRHFINTEHRVVAAVPLVHYPPGPVNINGESYFNIRCNKIVLPADDGDPAKWPWLYALFTNIFEPTRQHGHLPHEFFFAWLKRFYESGYYLTPNQGHGIILTGEAGQGKTFLGNRVIADLMGGAEDASHILSGRTNFSGNLAAAPLWAVDDTTNAPDYNHRRLFGELLKQQIANPFVNYHPKYADSRRVAWHGRVFITCNSDSSSLDVIPTLENSILDKLHLFKTSDYRHPYKSNDENAAILAQELPHMARFLLDWQPPAGIAGSPRFGSKPYHHPFVRTVAAESSPDYILSELLDVWLEEAKLAGVHTGKEWKGTSTALFGEFQIYPKTKELARTWSATKIGKALDKMYGVYTPYLGVSSTQGKKIHTFDLTAVSLSP